MQLPPRTLPHAYSGVRSRVLLALALLVVPQQAAAQASLSAIHDAVDDAMVVLEGSGAHAGFLLDEQYVAAAAHCLAHEAREGLRVRFHDGLEVPGRVVALRADLDLALVQIPLGHGHTPLPMATRGEDLAPNALLAHGGHPMGLEWAFTLGDYLGTVPDTGRRVRLHFAGSVHPGDSGGPLVCEVGQVHGVVVTRHASRAEGYAVPVEYLRDMLQALRAPPAPSASPTPPGPPAARRSAVPAPRPSPVQVTVYGAPWCGACRAATAWLGRQGIAHQERDASELGEPESIPVIVVQGPRGRVTLQGFSPASLTQALGQVR